MSILIVSCHQLLFSSKSNTARFLHGFIITSCLVIVQVILFDIRLAQNYPILQLFYLPYQFLAPVLYTAFTYAYLERKQEFKRYRIGLLVPFMVFLLWYLFLKVNVVLGYRMLSREMTLYISGNWDENIALLFGLFLAVWNYLIMASYVKNLEDLPYYVVKKKTQWLRRMYALLVCLNLIWLGIAIYLKLDRSVSGHVPYYPLWLLYLAFYLVFSILGSKHLQKKERNQKRKGAVFSDVVTDYRIKGLSTIFEPEELRTMYESEHQLTGILGYFATSLFDKKNEEDVLWEITKNCIAKLDLEDCVIYTLEEDQSMLVQKAAYGNKDLGERKILSPLKIAIGNGIVGKVAKIRQPVLVTDTSLDQRYIVDDMKRGSELAVPILFEGKLLGVLDSEHSNKGFFGERHLLLFQLIAKLTAIKLQQVSKKTPMVLTENNVYFKELEHLLQEEKIYQDPLLSLTSVAERLNISSTYLSQVVNTLSGQNFSDYINLFRIGQSKKMLVHPDFSQYTVLDIGLESGFNSRSAFYSSFKKHTGTTPTAYRNSSSDMS